jgi:hypothetical protein
VLILPRLIIKLFLRKYSRYPEGNIAIMAVEPLKKIKKTSFRQTVFQKFFQLPVTVLLLELLTIFTNHPYKKINLRTNMIISYK